MTTATGTLRCRVAYGRLLEAVTTVGIAIDRKPPLPVLGGALLEATDTTLTISATDYVTAATVTLDDLVVEQPGRVLLDHAELVKLLPTLVAGAPKPEVPQLPVTLRSRSDGAVTLNAYGHTMPVRTYPVDDYPSLPARPATVATLDRVEFGQQLRRTLTAAGTDEVLPALLHVQLQLTTSSLRMAATDRFRLAVADVDSIRHTDTDCVVLARARTLAAAAKHLTGTTVELGVDNTDGSLALTSDGVQIVTRIGAEYAEHFPAYERLFPQVNVTAAVSRAAMMDATKRAKRMLNAKKANPHVAVILHPAGAVTLLPHLDERADLVAGPEHHAEIDGLTEPKRIVFRADFLLDALTSISSDTVLVQLDPECKPVLFTGTDPADARAWHLLMTIREPGDTAHAADAGRAAA